MYKFRSKKGHVTTFFSEPAIAEQQLPLSRLDRGNPVFDQIRDLGLAILRAGHGMMDASSQDVDGYRAKDPEWLDRDIARSEDACQRVIELINSAENKNGEFYRYWFDSHNDTYQGDNVLLLAISRACHSVSDVHTRHVAVMVDAILKDAEKKLPPNCFKNFISFRYISPTEREHADYYFDNTPLTLAINTGLLDTANWILDRHVLSAADINIQCGKGYAVGERRNPGLLSAAHLAALRVNATGLEADLSLLLKLRHCGADFNLRDENNQTVEDLVKFTLPQFIQDCEERRDDINSNYAHQLNYDSRLIDVCGEPDRRDFYNYPFFERHPDVFLPYSGTKIDRAEIIVIIGRDGTTPPSLLDV